MRKAWSQLKNATMTKEEQRVAHALAMKDLAEMELAELREALHIRQDDLAKKMEVTQAAISRLERRPNVLLHTLANYIEGLGGKLELRAVLPNRTIKLTHLLAKAAPENMRVVPKSRRKRLASKAKA